MFIQDIRIKNYRCYKDLNLKFKSNNEKNIILITGETEAGKTSLVNAIGWCLYGQETQVLLKTKSGQGIEKPIPNETSYDASGVSRVSVRMTIKIPELPQMETIIITREAKFIKGKIGATHSEPPQVEVYNKAGDPQRYGNTGQLLQYILVPEELASFYLFDGEYLKQTEKFDMEINSGFNKLFRIDTFKQIGEVLNEISSDYSKEASRADSVSYELKSKYEELSRIAELIKNNAIELDEIEAELGKLRKDKEEVEEAAKTSIELSELKLNYEKLKNERELLLKDISNNSKFKGQEILQSAYLLNSSEIMNDAIKKITAVEEVRKERLPPDVKESFLTGLLTDEICICGTPLKKGSHEYHQIEEKIPNVVEINEKEFLIDLLSKLDISLNMQKRRKEKIVVIDKEIRETTIKSDKLDEEIKQITSKNKDIEKDTIKNPIDKLQYLDSQIKIQEARKETNRRNAEDLNSRKESVNEKIKNFEGKGTEKTKFLKNMEMTDALTSIIKAFSKEAINKFSELLEAEINNLLASNEKLSKFKFERKVLSGNEVIFTFKEIGSDLPYFSGGQAQLKGIIMIAAFTRIIERVAREKLPIPFVVMDHPIADVDTKRIEKIASEMGDMFHNSQVILFVADNKYDVFSKLAKEHIANKFVITNNSKSKESEIEEIKN